MFGVEKRPLTRHIINNNHRIGFPKVLASDRPYKELVFWRINKHKIEPISFLAGCIPTLDTD